jgi:hypothetical protein
MDRIMSIAPSELRPEGSKVHELMEISFARIRAALSGDTLPPSPNPPGRYPNIAAFATECLNDACGHETCKRCYDHCVNLKCEKEA